LYTTEHIFELFKIITNKTIESKKISPSLIQ